MKPVLWLIIAILAFFVSLVGMGFVVALIGYALGSIHGFPMRPISGFMVMMAIAFAYQAFQLAKRKYPKG